MAYGLIILIFTFIITLVVSVAIPVVIGISVYMDADKRVDCSPWLWALVAVFVPYFAGLIVYLIVRKDFALKPEYQKYDQNGNPVPGQSVGMATGTKVLLFVVLGAFVILLAGASVLVGIGLAEMIAVLFDSI